MIIPNSIKRHIGFRKADFDNIGCSDAQVLMFDDMVLKIQPDCNVSANEMHMMRWLQGKLPVPEIIETALVNDTRYLLMTRIPGRILCDSAILDDQMKLAELVADGLRQMWDVDVSTCPTNRTLEKKFSEIDEGLRRGSITREHSAQPETYGSDGFDSPAQLFDWLVKHRPEEENVLTHGDFCLPNIFADSQGLTALIDLGYAGVADKWVDIEKAIWSMWANTTGQFGGPVRPFDRKYLFDALELKPDEDKLRYYSLLSELC